MKDNSMQMSPAERARASILLVEPEALERNNLRTALRTLGFGSVTEAPTHVAALDKFNDRKFSHIIFDAKKTNYPMKEWLSKVFEYDPTVIALPSSANPSVDDVFDLLVIGAKGYLVKPFTIDTVDQAVLMATKGEPIADAVLQARDRNEALVAIMMSSLDKLATTYRQSLQFETAKRELPRSLAMLKRSSELAHTFAKGGEDGLLEALERFCIERSKGPATRLGRLRKRLSNTRAPDDSPEA
jgi:two-component system chemotaxis response regulator CheY